jgi:bacteriophage HK97-gp10 putative tail-component
MKAIAPGFSNVAIDASQFVDAAMAFGEDFDLEAGLMIEKAMRDSGQIVKRAVIKRAKRHYRTGRLERGIKVDEAGAGWDLVVRVRSTGGVAHLVAGRVKAHRIVSSAKTDPKSPAMPLYVGGTIKGFAQAVEHPATKGDPYFHVGAMNSRLAINAVLNATARRLAAHLADVIALKAGGHL